VNQPRRYARTLAPRVLSVAAAITTSLIAVPAQAASTPLDLRFDGVGFGQPADLSNGGSAIDLTVGYASPRGNHAVTVPSWSGSFHSLGLPATEGAEPGIVTIGSPITTPASPDLLDTGRRSFLWGADFSVSSTASGGNNIFQRGLTGGPQWKLSADTQTSGVHDIKCFLKMDEGASPAVSTEPFLIQPGDERWHRATCQRTGAGALSITVRRRSGSGWRIVWQHSTPAGSAVGPLTFEAPSTDTTGTLATVGGKVAVDGAIHPEPDQFNGRIDNVRLLVR
jgi:hypothetical protein